MSNTSNKAAFVASSPKQAPLDDINNNAVASPEVLPLTASAEMTDFALGQEHAPNTVGNETTSSSTNNTQPNVNPEPNGHAEPNGFTDICESEASPEPLVRPKANLLTLRKRHKQGYRETATKSYSELANASGYSLKENETVIEFGDDDQNKDNEHNKESDEGWPLFEPISGPYPLSVYVKDYKQLKNEVLSGFVVSFAQVPEAVAFSFLAGVDPFIGLHAAWIVGFITSFFGGRCAEISGATGATAAVLAPYMADPNVGVMYLPYIIGLVGIIIMIWGFIGVSKLISLVPHSCMIGFVNGLAVIIGSAQLGSFERLNEKHPEKGSAFYGELAWMIALTIITFLIVEYLPRLTKFVPATLVALLAAVFIEHVIIRMAAGMETVLIGELGNFSGGLPKIPGIDPYWDLPPFNMETFKIIIVPALTVALVSTVEDLLTIEVVHDLTNTRPRSVAKCELITKLQIIAMGAGNLICGFFGAIGGGATIGLATVNCYSANGRYRWSGVTCSICTFFIVWAASPALMQVPAGALVGLMLVVVVHTFEWASIPILIVTFLPLSARQWLNDKVFRGKWNVHRKIRRADGIIILLVTILTILTNLGYAIIAGVMFACLTYTWDSAKALKHSTITIKRPRVIPNLPRVQEENGKQAEPKKVKKRNDDTSCDEAEEEEEEDDGYEIVKIYTLEGPLLFSNANQLPSIFNWNGDPEVVEVQLQNCTIYDYTALNALNNVAEKYKKKEKQIHLTSINIKTKKSFEKATSLIPHFTYDVDVNEQQQFHPATRLNVAHGSRRQL
eukprot:CAMPEP_0197021692 /NCGR_PEP_ID=MMETSP1384-20130603/2630_1 /TAXON_ID=29189 /ORGANISM="Ammonia sp." /LENGTH=788 /DNA_ID=CAMNT_0042449581 /DNA_START=23 /DNA_END=2389 /DNA_ORIENTATION=-